MVESGLNQKAQADLKGPWLRDKWQFKGIPLEALNNASNPALLINSHPFQRNWWGRQPRAFPTVMHLALRQPVYIYKPAMAENLTK